VDLSPAALERFFETVQPHLNERQRRVVAGAFAEALGRGGQARVAAASGMSTNTLWKAVGEVRAGVEPSDRQRRPGGGDKPQIDKQPGLLEALDELVHPETRGNPMSMLRWTSKSTYELADELVRQGFRASAELVRRLLHQMGYSLQAPAKQKEGAQHPDRDAQFAYLNDTVASFVADDQPVISVDTKKKELIGEYRNGGREWQLIGEPVEVKTHDFIDLDAGKAVPYGVYDLAADEGWVSVGDSADTSEFAVEAIRRWWENMGKARYPSATRLLVTADAGGSNGYRIRAFKVELATLAKETGLEITVCHYPPGTSKWNKIEHRMFSFITMNWRGRPLVSFRTVIESITSTTTRSGLRIRAERDWNYYETGRKVTDAELDAVPLTRHEFHGDWNYTIASAA
jgi:transposase